LYRSVVWKKKKERFGYWELWKLQMLHFHISSAQFAFQGLYTHSHF
jgi:hypothetical protein